MCVVYLLALDMMGDEEDSVFQRLDLRRLQLYTTPKPGHRD